MFVEGKKGAAAFLAGIEGPLTSKSAPTKS